MWRGGLSVESPFRGCLPRARPLVMALVEVRLCWRGVEEDGFVWETFFFDRGAVRALRGGILGAITWAFHEGFTWRFDTSLNRL